MWVVGARRFLAFAFYAIQWKLLEMSDDDAPDDWDQRIIDTGCAKENLALQLCHADKGDWRQCIQEVCAGVRTELPGAVAY